MRGAVITAGEITFAIALVQKIENPIEAKRTSDKLSPTFGNIPVVLMTRDIEGNREQIGREDLVNFVKEIPFESIPFRDYPDLNNP